MKRNGRKIAILCLADRRRCPEVRLLRKAGYFVTECYSPDHAVALAVNNEFQIALLDQDSFVETDGWSVAQSLKLVRPQLCVVLLSRAIRLIKRVPEGVDAMLSHREPLAVLGVVKRLLAERSKSAAA